MACVYPERQVNKKVEKKNLPEHAAGTPKPQKNMYFACSRVFGDGGLVLTQAASPSGTKNL